MSDVFASLFGEGGIFILFLIGILFLGFRGKP